MRKLFTIRTLVIAVVAVLVWTNKDKLLGMVKGFGKSAAPTNEQTVAEEIENIEVTEDEI